jgi:demethylmenaquinone methyltransferase/2-methoxy-6-polyprenyl-1,4-benzoquinol methylase
MQRYYADRAPEYDSIYAKPERQADLRLIERWLPEVFRGPQGARDRLRDRLLDAVHRAGRNRGGRDRFRSGDDRHRQGRVPPGKVDFVIGDAYALPDTGRNCSGGFAGFWISHVPRSRVREFLRGFHARLEPGAKVVLLDNRFVEAAARRSASATPRATRFSRAACATAPRIGC